jgi:hypothetical protein
MRAPLISVERLGSSFFEAGLTPALVGYELYWSLVEDGVLYLTLVLNREHLVEEISFARCYANESFVAAEIQQFCLCWVGSFLGSNFSLPVAQRRMSGFQTERHITYNTG